MISDITNKRKVYISYNSVKNTAKLCREVKEKIILLNKLGEYPSLMKIGKHFSSPAIFKRKEVYDTWKNTLKELNLR